MAIDEAARDARGKRAAIILFDLRAGGFHELAVFHARGAGRLASAAIEAPIDVANEGIAERQAAFVHQNHLTDAPARRIGLEAPEAVGGAMIETQAAVNAMQVVDVAGTVRTAEAARLRIGWAQHWLTGRWLAVRWLSRHRFQMPP